jgi:hypothetical protein
MTTMLDHAHQTETSRAASPAVLRELVQRHRVCWESWPEYLMVKREKRQIGFSLELSGTHERGVEHPSPGCQHCRAVYAALQTIAVYILPRELRPSRYEIESYQPAISYSVSRRNRPDVTLTIRIVHRQGYERPVDECEERCLEEMKQRLRELGACERHWVPAKENNS